MIDCDDWMTVLTEIEMFVTSLELEWVFSLQFSCCSVPGQDTVTSGTVSLQQFVYMCDIIILGI